MAEKSPEELGRYWFAYLNQDTYWMPDRRPRVLIAEMDPHWAGNALRWLERRAETARRHYEHGKTLAGAPALAAAGEPGAYWLPELIRRDESDAGWLRATPLCLALAARESGGQDT